MFKSILLFLISLLACWSVATFSAPHENIQWKSYSESVFQSSKSQTRLVFIFASADWCSWCQKMKETTFQNSQIIQAINANYIPIFLDFGKNKPQFDQYNVEELPSIIILNENQQILKVFSGYISSEKLLPHLNALSIQPNKNVNTTVINASKISDNTLDLKEKNDDKKSVILEKGSLLLISLVFWTSGLLLAFTPCFFPLILLIIGFLGAQCETVSKRTIIYLGLTYVLAISFTYAAMGIIAALFGVYLNAYFQEKWLIILFSLFFIFLATALLGLYNLRLPEAWRRFLVRHNKLQAKYTYLEVALMGVFGTLIASPCIVAPLAGILVFIGEKGSILLGSVALFFIGLGMGTPLLAALMLGIQLPSIQKISHLLDGIKIFFGLLLMTAGLWLLSRVIPGVVSMLLWSILVVFTAMCMNIPEERVTNNFWKLWKALRILLLAYGIILFIGALIGNTNPLQPLDFSNVLGG
jgi:thiol:disulfide interchange protein